MTVPVIRFASGVEPEYKNKNHHEPKLADNGPRQIKLSPNHGKEETMITVVVHAFPDHTPAKLAFNNLLVDTDQIRKQDVTSLVASVPPFRHICSSTLTVPVYICFFNEEIVTSTWLVANFKYDRTDEELSSHNISMNSGLHMRGIHLNSLRVMNCLINFHFKIQTPITLLPQATKITTPFWI